MKLKDIPAPVWYISAGVVVFFVIANYAKKGAGAVVSAASAAAHAVNPINQDNIFNTGFNDVYQGITGSSGTFGSDLYDWTHPNGPGSNGAPTTNGSGHINQGNQPGSTTSSDGLDTASSGGASGNW